MTDPLDNQTTGEQLRRLLLQEEQERLDQLEARLGSDDALRTSLVPLIADVLRDAGVQDYQRLAGALAPIVLQSIKTEIHNSRDMMVDALYPITGRLVAAAVRNAFRDMVEQLNQKLDQSLSVDRWRARVKAKVTGQSEAEILLSEGAAFEITDLLLINRETGFLVTQTGAGEEQGGMDSQLLGSILTAIMAFVRDAMSSSPEQDLRTLHVGDLRLHLQVSPAVILAIKTKGPPPAGFDTALNATFCAFLADWGDTLSTPDDIDDAKQAALSEDLEKRFQALLQAKQSNFKEPSKKGTILLAALALLGIGLLGWHVYGRWERDRVETEARAVIEGMPSLNGYPLTARYRDDEEMIGIDGLTPNEATLTTLRMRLQEALPETDFEFKVQSLPASSVDLSRLATKAELTQSASAIEDELAAAIDQNAGALRLAIDRFEKVLPTEDERRVGAFQSWIDQQTLWFDEGSRFDDDAEALAMLERMSRELKTLPSLIGILVVGYSDDTGEARSNGRISLERAETIAQRLEGYGIQSERLAAVGRSSEKRISQQTGRGSANRRVEFEMTLLPPDSVAAEDGMTVEGDNVER
ncbi:MAG: OmpA family protein [Geminicoccales bacterium]